MKNVKFADLAPLRTIETSDSHLAVKLGNYIYIMLKGFRREPTHFDVCLRETIHVTRKEDLDYYMSELDAELYSLRLGH